MADPLRASDRNGIANVEAQVARRDQPQRQFPGMQRQRHGRMTRLQEGEHPHVQRIVADRDRIMLGRGDIDPDEAWIGPGQREAERQLREHLRRRAGTDRGVEIAYRDVAGGGVLRRGAAVDPRRIRLRVVVLGACARHGGGQQRRHRGV